MSPQEIAKWHVEKMSREMPRGRLPSRPRRMVEIASDLRHAVYGIIRLRKNDVLDQNGAPTFSQLPLGTGFFVSPTILLSCNHVFNHPLAPHQPGDSYRLVKTTVNEQNAIGGWAVNVFNPELGNDLVLYPDLDLALLRVVVGDLPISYTSLDFGQVLPGREIGVAGYPLAKLGPDSAMGHYSTFRYRVARGTVNSSFFEPVVLDGGKPGKIVVPKIEVNFLFVPGNSGGPIFDVETGNVLGFVHGYTNERIQERIEKVMIPRPDTVPEFYVLGTTAVYSIGIGVTVVKDPLERFEKSSGVSPSASALTAGRVDEPRTSK